MINNVKLSHSTILDMSCMRLTMVDERGKKKKKVKNRKAWFCGCCVIYTSARSSMASN